MIICIALDDNNGMIFNNRRQSKDKYLRNDILNICNGKKLWISEYTSQQFDEPLPDNIIVDGDFINKAEENDYCFVENPSVLKYVKQIDKLIIYKWNRVYPADTYFDIQLTEDEWTLLSAEEFKGYSHDKITKEVWINAK